MSNNQPTQDWVTVLMTKTKEKKPMPTPQKPQIDTHQAEPLPKVTVELKKEIQQARLLNKLSQKDLAQKMNIPVSVIIDYEKGTAIPDNSFIAKLEKILDTKLPRIKKVKPVEEK
jgi:ribosome-binding protein aMBF1 (putative translation factor)